MGLALLGVIGMIAAYLAGPWAARRLSRYFEDLIGEALNIPVVIASVETSPFSRLTLTQLSSVSATATGRMELEAREISFYYEPLELLSAHLRTVVLTGPRLFLNLDSNLEGIAQIPDIPPPPVSGGDEPVAPPDSTSEYLPFTVDKLAIRSGKAVLGIAGRTLELANLRLSLFGFGHIRDQSFQVSTEAFGASIASEGGVDLTVDAGRILPRYTFRDTSVRIEDLELRRCIEWLRGQKPGSAGDDAAGGNLADLLVSLLETGSGRLRLDGTLKGVWPERVELDVSSNTTDLAATYGSVGVTGGEATMRLKVVVQGQFESIDFDLSVDATGRLRADESLTDEAVAVTARGRYIPKAGGTLQLDKVGVDFRDTGRVELSGEVTQLAAITLGVASPRLDLSVVARGLDARRLDEFQLVDVPPWAPVTLAGGVDLDLHAQGPLFAPRLDGTIGLPLILRPAYDGAPSAPLTVAATLTGLKVDASTLDTRIDAIDLSAKAIDLETALTYLPPAMRFDRHGISLSDPTIEAAARFESLTFGQGGVSGTINASTEISGVDVTSEDLWLEFAGVHARVSLETRLGRAGHEIPLELTARLELDEFLVGDVQASLSGTASDLRARGTWTFDADGPERLDLEELVVSTPLTGRGQGTARLARGRGSTGSRLDLRLGLREVPTSRAFQTFVRAPLEHAAPIVKTLQLEGRSAIDLTVNGPLRAPSSRGRWQLSGGAFKAGALTLYGLQFDCPFELGGSVAPDNSPALPQPGRLSIERIASPLVNLRTVDLPFVHSSGVYTLLGPVDLKQFGGEIDIQTLVFTPAAKDGPALKIAGEIVNVDLDQLTRAYGWVPVDGHLDASFHPVRFQGGRIEWSGSVDVQAFGGRLRSTDFVIEDLFQPYVSFEMRQGVIDQVHLAELGTTFNFGLISGVVQGRVEDLQLVAGQLTSFRIDFETVPVSGVSQFVNRQAVKSLRRVLEGPFGDLEETFFSKFVYDRFGLTADLEDDTFRLHGKYHDERHEYIMLARWYQFPRIDIINGNPKHSYDWRAIMDSLEKIYETTAEDPPGQ